ncbi:N-acetylmuramoyl-L-alanine amidase [Novosphingobium aquiterrae]|uniref:N-acetylmuramoyl-L-alanine amidase n=1 Tax=Novosphingobium aquiterrae TaxID=624388 RepID=A0ABV6PHF5_9SPHN
MRRWIILPLVFVAPLAVFAAMIGADRLFGAPGRGFDYVVKVRLPAADGVVGLPPVEGPQDASRPLVVIDAGHGGKDPGAGTGTLKEKDVTLALARALRDELLQRGGIRVALTRGDDRFLVLGERSSIARRLGADLFISIHADSTGDNAAAQGASVYTLSDKGTSEAASRFAARENAADVINGVDLGGTTTSVSSILVDLSQRESLARSQQFANLILREGAGRIPFREKSEQSAAFAVLKAPDIASVLFETGYISNADDAARLSSPQGRQALAQVTAKAIEAYFARLRASGARAAQGLEY